VFVQDMAGQAIALHGQASSTEAQSTAALTIVRKPRIEHATEDAFVSEVLGYSGAYEMKG
jgi:acyl-CoA dehydrogenase